MKKVLLLGDSIRLGYQEYVQENLKDLVEVYWPQDSCRYAQHTLRWVHTWKENEKFPDELDVVHWNVGLWDVLRIFDDGTFTSPEFYGELIKRLYNRLRMLFPKAKQIFATSTSVVEEEYQYPYKRFNADIEKFNKIAIETLVPLGVAINDLYALTKGISKECRSDMTHFYTEDGIKAVGGQVVDSICRALGVSYIITKTAEASVPQLSEELVGK